MKKHKNIRALHRDLGYFYLGLIISFAFSGILMNHREVWHPEEYDVNIKEIQVKLPEESRIDESYGKNFIAQFGIEDKFRRFKIKENKLRISYQNTDVEVDMATGKGELETFKKTPVISQMMRLHKNTSDWWIYYSDIFGLSLITIAVTGALMISVGKHTFKRRGWKLAVAGIVFPLLFLFLLA